MMDKYDIQRLRDLPIEGVAGRLGLRVQRHKALCPFHDDHHASLSFHNGKYRCFVCGASGDTISLARQLLQKGFVDTCRWLADEHNVIMTEYKPEQDRQQAVFDASRYVRYFEHPWLSDEARRFLFQERRLDQRVVAWCRMTSWKDRRQVPWLQIPYYDRDGRLVGVQNRNLVRGGEPRFRFPGGSECGIYNLPVLNLLQPREPLYIAEGCSDCWAMLSAGHKAIAIPSATLLKARDRQLLRDLNSELQPQFHMFPDRDAPGERLFMQLQQLLPAIVHHQLPIGCKDYSDLYLQRRPP